jgi:hypothetical protein
VGAGHVARSGLGDGVREALISRYKSRRFPAIFMTTFKPDLLQSAYS